MKLLRFAAIALLAVIPMTACDDDDDPGPTPGPTIVGTVSGTVSVGGTGIAGVTVSLVGAASQSATTGAGGTYSFANVPAGTYALGVEAPDGALAGFALGWLDPSSGVGQVEPVGTDPKHRGKGLARAATTELVRRLHARGATQVTLYTHSNSLVHGIYHELGFRSVTRSQRYIKVSAPER